MPSHEDIRIMTEEIRTCPECLGSGEYGSKKDQFCRECNGEGYIE